MNVILLGYRGSGKTSVGRALAARLGYAFVDTDDAVRERFGGREIADVWATEGEPAFRAMEVAVTKVLLQRDGVVIALGGGTVMQHEARAAVEAADACRVYLKCEVAELARRLGADAATAAARPSLTGSASSIDEIAAVLAEREPTYRAVADEVIDVTGRSVAEIVARLSGG